MANRPRRTANTVRHPHETRRASTPESLGNAHFAGFFQALGVIGSIAVSKIAGQGSKPWGFAEEFPIVPVFERFPMARKRSLFMLCLVVFALVLMVSATSTMLKASVADPLQDSLAVVENGASGWASVLVPAVPAESAAAPAPDKPAESAASAAAKSTESFKKGLLAAADKAYREKQISRLKLARVRIAVAFNRQAVAEMQETFLDEAVASGDIKPGDAMTGAIDFAKWIDIIQKFLPILLQILAIFGV